jgi:hypothetical protein
VNQEDIQKIKEIIDDLKCPKDFKCYKQGFEGLCQVKDVGLDSVVECLEINRNECTNGCTFRVSYGHAYYCTCPLRVYIAKRLKK